MPTALDRLSFAGRLQHHRSGGSARSVRFKIQGTDIRAKIASMATFQPSGKLYDGHGVDPDLVIEPSPGFFIGKDDPVLERAIQVIE